MKPENTSRILSMAASILSRHSFPGPKTKLKIIGIMSRIFPGYVKSRMGVYSFLLDPGDYFQREMALDCYENEVREIYRSVLRTNDTYVDVGAQLGFLAAVAAGQIGPGSRMILFEPDPRALSRLRKTLAEADKALAPETFLVEKACSDARGALTMELAEILGQSRVVPPKPEPGGKTMIEIPTTRGDDELEDLGVKGIRLLKMDVEGHELKALAGLSRFLEGKKIDCLLIEHNEVLLNRSGHTGRHLHAMVARHGYVGMHVERRIPIRKDTFSEEVLLENLFYAKDRELLLSVFHELEDQPKTGEDFSNQEIEDLARQAVSSDHPQVRANLIITMAREKDLAGAITAGLSLLEEHPGLADFRGHVAWWLSVTGDIEKAKDQYRKYIDEKPDDKEALRLLEKLEKADHGSD